METNKHKSIFMLRMRDISTSNVVGDYPLSNIAGTISQYRTSITWNAVNIQNIIGRDLYAKYDIFNIQMSAAGYSIGTTVYGTTADDRCVNFAMSGLDWQGSNYNVVTLNKTNESIMNCAIYGGQATSNVGNMSQILPNISFRKCITTNITINLYTVLGVPPNTNIGTMFPQMSFTFIITPLL
jgi:hypothetical protein